MNFKNKTMKKEILKEWIELNVDADLKGASVEYYSKETFINALHEFNRQTNQDDAPDESVGFSFNAAGAKMGLSAEEVNESLKALKKLFDSVHPGKMVSNPAQKALDKWVEQIQNDGHCSTNCSCEKFKNP